jgi:hypothetical protein
MSTIIRAAAGIHAAWWWMSRVHSAPTPAPTAKAAMMDPTSAA